MSSIPLSDILWISGFCTASIFLAHEIVQAYQRQLHPAKQTHVIEGNRKVCTLADIGFDVDRLKGHRITSTTTSEPDAAAAGKAVHWEVKLETGEILYLFGTKQRLQQLLQLS